MEAIPRKPFFGTTRDHDSSFVYRSDDPKVEYCNLDSVRYYLQRLIVVENVRIPRQWWQLATQAVYNYEVTHDE